MRDNPISCSEDQWECAFFAGVISDVWLGKLVESKTGVNTMTEKVNECSGDVSTVIGAFQDLLLSDAPARQVQMVLRSRRSDGGCFSLSAGSTLSSGAWDSNMAVNRRWSYRVTRLAKNGEQSRSDGGRANPLIF